MIFFLNDFYLSFYQKVFVLGEEVLIVSVFITLENILAGKNALIKKIFKEKEFIFSILDIINEKKMNLDVLIHFLKFFKMIIIEIKDEYIKEKHLFYLIFDRIYSIYKLCDKKDLNIIKEIFLIIIYAFECKYQNKNSDENYIIMHYLFKERELEENQAKNIKFVYYILSSLYNNPNFYLINDEMLYVSLILLDNITYNCNLYEINEITTCGSYKFLEILNNYIKYKIKNNVLNNQNESCLIIKLLKISNNIIDFDFQLARKLVFTEFFENLIIYFSKNLSNKTVVEIFLDTFLRLLGHEDKIIADNLFKRGILYEGIFCSLLNNCDYHFNEKMVLKMMKIILNYFQIVFHIKQEDKFSREDILFYSKFKDFITNSNIISEEIRESILSLDIMKIII